MVWAQVIAHELVNWRSQVGMQDLGQALEVPFQLAPVAEQAAVTSDFHPGQGPRQEAAMFLLQPAALVELDQPEALLHCLREIRWMLAVLLSFRQVVLALMKVEGSALSLVPDLLVQVAR